MAENPLLPHRKLQELYALMERVKAMERKRRGKAATREAVLAATAIHLEPGDLLHADADAATAAVLAPGHKHNAPAARAHTPSLPRTLLAAAEARGAKASAAGRVVVVAVDSGSTETGWQEALAWAQEERLPWIFVCIDAGTGAGKKGSLTWEAAARACKRVQLPTLTVDGDDAVAVFRVMQEAVLRARNLFGPSLVWAVLTSAQDPGSKIKSPAQRMRSYMLKRGVSTLG